MNNLKKGFLTPLFIILAVVAIGVGVYYSLSKPKQESASTVSNAPATQAQTTTSTLPAQSVQQTFTNGQLSFSYPHTWTVSADQPYPSDSPDLYNYTVTKGLAGGETLQVIFNTGIDGVGGACPDYDPANSVFASTPLKIAGQNFYFIFAGDNTAKREEYGYLSDSANGECPNLPFVTIKGLPGLFSAFIFLIGTGTTTQANDYGRIDLNSQNGLGISDLKEAEGILASVVPVIRTSASN